MGYHVVLQQPDKQVAKVIDDTVFLRIISARGTYFKFRGRRGRLFNYQIVALHDHFSDTLSVHKHQHKLFIGIKS